IDEPFMASEINLTRAMMVALGSALGECSRELARIGSPTERLQPVHAIVAQACAQYDEGAQCFDTAAGASDESGAVVVGTPEERTQADGLDCASLPRGMLATSLRKRRQRARRSPTPRSANHVTLGASHHALRFPGSPADGVTRCHPAWTAEGVVVNSDQWTVESPTGPARGWPVRRSRNLRSLLRRGTSLSCPHGRRLRSTCRPVVHELQLPRDADRCDVTVRGEQVVEWEESTTIRLLARGGLGR
ncbi:MAG TPA: hypothetical protein VFR74_03545, partial [Jiangellales bacterium]|nr:hypothetical protein [Jiangellales bacterium]